MGKRYGTLGVVPKGEAGHVEESGFLLDPA